MIARRTFLKWIGVAVPATIISTCSGEPAFAEKPVDYSYYGSFQQVTTLPEYASRNSDDHRDALIALLSEENEILSELYWTNKVRSLI